MRHRAAVAAGLALVLGLPTSVVAQGKPAQRKPAQSIGDRVTELSAKVDEALKASADVPVALKALQDLQTRVTELKQQLDKAGSMERGYTELRSKVDEYEERIGDLELRLSAITLRMSDERRGNAGYDRGFFLRSSDRRYQLRLNAVLQAGYVGRLYTETRNYEGSDIGRDESTFALREARLGLGGHLIDPRLSYSLLYDLADRQVLSLYGDLQLLAGLRVRAGKMKVPASLQFLNSVEELQFTGRAAATDAFAPRRELGVMVHGEILADRLAYNLGIFNGAGTAAEVDNNTDFLYVARAVFSPLGAIDYNEGDWERGPLRLAVGGSFYFDLAPTDIALREGITDPQQARVRSDLDEDGVIDNVAIYGVGGELALRYRGLSYQGEVFYRVEDPGSVLPTNRKFWGFYNQLGFFYEPASLEVAARHGYSKPPNYGLERTVFRPNRMHELSIVIAALPWGRLIKWQAEYTLQWLRDIERAIDADSIRAAPAIELHQVTLQFQLAF